MDLRVLRIVEGTSVDGPGLRTAVYLAGCHHHCEGCHNPQSWPLDGGTSLSTDDVLRRIGEAGAPVTLTGGDPLAQPEAVLRLARCIKVALGLNLWCYTGYTWEQVIASPELRAVMAYVDVLVDSPFLLEQRDTTLLFRGSRNQRLIDVQASLAAGQVVVYNTGEAFENPVWMQ